MLLRLSCLLGIVVALTLAAQNSRAAQAYESHEEIVEIFLDLLENGTDDAVQQFFEKSANTQREAIMLKSAAAQFLSFREQIGGLNYFRHMQTVSAGETIYISYYFMEAREDQGLFLELGTVKRADNKAYFVHFSVQTQISTVRDKFKWLKFE